MASRGTGSPGRLHRHQPNPTRRTRGGLLQPAGHSGTAYQGRQECHPVDAPVVPEIPQQRGPASASRPGLQPRQLHADAGLAEGGGALVSDHAQGEADQDWCQGREPRPVRHFPTGGGCGAEGAVPKNPPPHRWAAAGPCAAVTTAHPVAIPAARQDRCVLRRSKCALPMRSGHRVGLLITKISPIKCGLQPIMTAQGRIRSRMPILLSLSAAGRSNPGNPGQ